MNVQTSSPGDVFRRLQEGKPLEIVDVRTPAEFAAVHAEGARLVPLDTLDPQEIMQARNASAGEPLYVICQSGARAAQAVKRFASAGFDNVVSVDGGTAAWEQAGLPVVRGAKRTISLEKAAPREVPALHKLQDLLNDTLNQARALAHGLNPIDVRAGGLAKALHELCVRVTDAFHVDCGFCEKVAVEVADNTTAIHLYRVAQEAISNAIKHGGAKRIRIALSGSGDGHLTLTITDNGRGFPATPNPRAGRGLQIMQYRASIIGATLVVRAGDAGGVVVTCSLRSAAIARTTDVPPAETTRRAASPSSPRRGKKPAARKRRR